MQSRTGALRNSKTAGLVGMGVMRNNTASSALAHTANSTGRQTLRMADNTKERIKRHVDDQKFLDTTPNADINITWSK